jgi:predicted secreted Zn-dependent protease
MTLKHLRAFYAIALLCLALNPAFAQPHRLLTVNEFQGTPRSNGQGVIAYTNCTIDFKYQANNNNGNYILHANVRMTMNNYKSWIDRSRINSQEQLAEVLKHEQGHYTIAYLEQQEVLRAIEHTRFTYNYNAEAMNIFNRIDAKYRQLNQDYDEDTEHMVNRQQQHSWDIYFAKRLQYMPQENASL